MRVSICRKNRICRKHDYTQAGNRGMCIKHCKKHIHTASPLATNTTELLNSHPSFKKLTTSPFAASKPLSQLRLYLVSYETIFLSSLSLTNNSCQTLHPEQTQKPCSPSNRASLTIKVGLDVVHLGKLLLLLGRVRGIPDGHKALDPCRRRGNTPAMCKSVKTGPRQD